MGHPIHLSMRNNPIFSRDRERGKRVSLHAYGPPSKGGRRLMTDSPAARIIPVSSRDQQKKVHPSSPTASSLVGQKKKKLTLSQHEQPCMRTFRRRGSGSRPGSSVRPAQRPKESQGKKGSGRGVCHGWNGSPPQATARGFCVLYFCPVASPPTNPMAI